MPTLGSIFLGHPIVHDTFTRGNVWYNKQGGLLPVEVIGVVEFIVHREEKLRGNTDKG